MLRRLLVATAVVVLVVALVMGITRSRASYTVAEVVTAFGEQGYRLENVGVGSGGWTAYAPLSHAAGGTFLFPAPANSAPFYVLVARSDLGAKQFFEPLAKAGGGTGVFDFLQGNVVISSDASLTDVGLSRDERARIRTAMRSLDETG